MKDEEENEKAEQVRDPRQKRREHQEDRGLERTVQEGVSGQERERGERGLLAGGPGRQSDDEKDGGARGHEKQAVRRQDPQIPAEQVFGPADRPRQDHLQGAARDVARNGSGREQEDPPVHDDEPAATSAVGESERLDDRQDPERHGKTDRAVFLTQVAADHFDHGPLSEKSSSSSAETRAS